jgi:hypothetical protein
MAMSEEQEELLVTTLMSSRPEEEADDDEEEDGDGKNAAGPHEPIHIHDLMILVCAYMVEVVGKVPKGGSRKKGGSGKASAAGVKNPFRMAASAVKVYLEDKEGRHRTPQGLHLNLHTSPHLSLGVYNPHLSTLVLRRLLFQPQGASGESKNQYGESRR